MLSFIFLFNIISVFCLKLDLIDDYFINVYIGDSHTKLKLLVDPTYQHTFILKPYDSRTRKSSYSNPLNFTNIYGNYSGKWTTDIFYFKEENITMEIQFLDIYDKKLNLLKADGVLGLGYYYYENIFFNLNCSHENDLVIYDKKNKKISICEPDQSTKSNKNTFSFGYNPQYTQGELTLSKINIESNNSEININKGSLVGLIPVLIPTYKETKLIFENYLKDEEKKGIKTKSEKKYSNDEMDEIVEKLSLKLLFEDKEYLYEYNDKKNISQIESFLDLDEFEKNIKNNINKWYIGLDNKDIERIEFNYDKQEINIFFISYKYLIIRITLFILPLGFFIYAILNVLKKKKENNPKSENEQELIDI